MALVLFKQLAAPLRWTSQQI